MDRSHHRADWGYDDQPPLVPLWAGLTGRIAGELTHAARFDNGVHPDNEEQGADVWICRAPPPPLALPPPPVT